MIHLSSADLGSVLLFFILYAAECYWSAHWGKCSSLQLLKQSLCSPVLILHFHSSMLCRTNHWSVFWFRLIKSTPSNYIYLRSILSWSQWVRGLRHGSAATGGMDACLLRLLCVVRCLCDGLITRPKESYQVWCVLSVISKPWPGGDLGPLGLLSHEKKSSILILSSHMCGLG
jgi:hypothetical protein